MLTFFSKTFQHICVSLDVNFNESLTNDVVSFEQLGPDFLQHTARDMEKRVVGTFKITSEDMIEK